MGAKVPITKCRLISQPGVVKIRYKQIALILIVFGIIFALSGIAYAGNLSIEDVKVYVDGKKDTGIVDVSPGSEVRFNVKVNNLFTKTVGNLEIEDITITVTIFDIDDGDEIDGESKEFNLDPDDDKTQNIIIQIPLEVDEDTYKVEIIAEGDDENGTTQKSDIEELKIDVEKESHEVLIRRATLSLNNLKCARSTQLSLNFMNLGTEEEDVRTTVTSPELALDKVITFTLGEDPFDSDSKYSTTVPVIVGSDVEAGVYPIAVKAEYADGTESKDASVDLVVEECVKPQPKTPPKEEDEELLDTVVTPPVIQPPVITPPVDDTGDEVTEETGLGSLLSDNLPIVGFIAFDIIIIIVVIVLIANWARKKQ